MSERIFTKDKFKPAGFDMKCNICGGNYAHCHDCGGYIVDYDFYCDGEVHFCENCYAHLKEI